MWENYKFIYKISKLCILLFSNYNISRTIFFLFLLLYYKIIFSSNYNRIPSFNKISKLGFRSVRSFVRCFVHSRAWSLSFKQRERYLDCS